MSKFKIGDKVLLDHTKCTQEQLDEHGCNGDIGKVYTIYCIKENFNDWEGHNIVYNFSTANWHGEGWLTLYKPVNKRGGNLL